MAGNVVAGGVMCDLFDLQVTGDPAPEGGTPTEVAVSFRFLQPFYQVFWQPVDWPWTVKVLAEGYGPHATERIFTETGVCNQNNPEYTVPVPITLNREGVYKVSAIVELDNNAGFVMGYSEKDVQITVWTAI